VSVQGIEQILPSADSTQMPLLQSPVSSHGAMNSPARGATSAVVEVPASNKLIGESIWKPSPWFKPPSITPMILPC
jgi:hypothetical protein